MNNFILLQLFSSVSELMLLKSWENQRCHSCKSIVCYFLKIPRAPLKYRSTLIIFSTPLLLPWWWQLHQKGWQLSVFFIKIYMNNNLLFKFKLITNRWAWELVLRKVGWGPFASMEHSREVSMATLSVGTSPSSSHQPALSHWRNLSGNTYLTPYLPGSDFQRGWKGQGSTKLASEAM